MESECEFSRRFSVAELGAEEVVMEIAADAEERAALCRRFDLLALDVLTATARIERAGGGAVRVAADFVADLVQSCVVTLEPVAGRVEDRLDVLLAPPTRPAQAEVLIAPLGDDEPEELTGDVIDIGKIVAEHLGLALDPYPRRPGAAFTGAKSDAGSEGENESPFAALKDLHPRS